MTYHVPLTDEELAEMDDWYGHGPINWATGQRLIADLRATRAENRRLQEAISAMRQGLA